MLTKSKIQSKVQSDTQEMMKISSGKSTIKTVFSSKPKEHHVSEYETIIAMVRIKRFTLEVIQNY